MASSKLLKEAIADAKAVKKTALENAKIALQEAFTPRLQSILSKKMKAEAEAEEDDMDAMEEELDSSGIGTKPDGETPGPAPKGFDADTEVESGEVNTTSAPVGSELDDYDKVKDLNEEEGEEEFEAEPEMDDEFGAEPEMDGGDEFGIDDMGGGDEFEAEPEMGGGEEGEVDFEMEPDSEEEDDLDLEAIIRELEAQLEEEEGEEEFGAEPEMEDEPEIAETYADGAEAGTDKGEDPKVVMTTEEEGEEGSEEEAEDDQVVDLDEILREMEAEMAVGDDGPKVDTLKSQLAEAYKTIKSLKHTINEVNLLNAKLLYANKLFRAYNMTNEQKVKVIETLDRTKSVREIKLVFSTLAENLRFSPNKVSSKAKNTITEGASRAIKSTGRKSVISESKKAEAVKPDEWSRFKQLAGIATIK